MDETVAIASLAAQDAAEALIALAWPVVPAGDDMDQWQIGAPIWTDDDLMQLATCTGIHSPCERLQ